jgi:hypothetical protein
VPTTTSTRRVELRGPVADLARSLAGGTVPPELLIVGAAGTGKTYGILLVLHALSLQVPNLRVMVARKTRDSLTESVLPTYEQEILPLTGHGRISEGIIRRIRQSYTYPNGTEWIVGGLDKPNKILSTSYDIGFVNEAIELTETDWETLQTRVGRPGRSHDLNILLGDTNPGEASHWFKRRLKEGKTPHWTSTHRDNPAMYREGEWTEEGLRYLSKLKRLTGSRRARFLEGRWVVGEGAWFDAFDAATHVSRQAGYDARFPVYLAVDSGVHTGAVWFQINDTGFEPVVDVIADLYLQGKPAAEAARMIVRKSHEVCGKTPPYGYTDPAGGAKTAVGPTVLGEYEKEGLYLSPWPMQPVLDGLALVESLVAINPPRLRMHPHCEATVEAFGNYKRKQVQGQWVDRPEDPQHPYEDMIDALRGGLMATIGLTGGTWGESPISVKWRG